MKLETATQPQFSMFSYASQPIRALSSIYSTIVENRGTAIAISVLSYATLASAATPTSKPNLAEWNFETLSQLIGDTELNTALKIGGCAIALLVGGIYLLRRSRSNVIAEKKADAVVQLKESASKGSVTPTGHRGDMQDLDATFLPNTPGVVHQTPQDALKQLKKTFRAELGKDQKIQAMLSLYTGLVIMAEGNIASARDQFKSGYNFVKKGEEIFDDLTYWVLKCDELIKAEAHKQPAQPLEGGKQPRNPAKAGPSQQLVQAELRKQSGQTREAVATKLQFGNLSPIVPMKIAHEQAPEDQEKSNSNIPQSHVQEDQQQQPSQAQAVVGKQPKYNPESPAFVPPKTAQAPKQTPLVEESGTPDQPKSSQPKVPTPPPAYKAPIAPSEGAQQGGVPPAKAPEAAKAPHGGGFMAELTARKKKLKGTQKAPDLQTLPPPPNVDLPDNAGALKTPPDPDKLPEPGERVLPIATPVGRGKKVTNTVEQGVGKRRSKLAHSPSDSPSWK